MRLTWTFFHVFRLMWACINIAILAVTASGWRDLSGLTFMLSFPASVVAGLIALPFDATGWSATMLVTLLTGAAAVVSGYVQWFVIGRALAHRITARCPVRRLLRGVLEAGVVSASLVLGTIGLEIVQGEEQAGHFIDRAMTVREGMSGKQVQSLLGDPKQVFDLTATPEAFSLCSADAVRVASYWYEHEWLPSPLVRGSFFLALCLDSQGRVVQVSFGHV